jgi:hypothetical protein
MMARTMESGLMRIGFSYHRNGFVLVYVSLSRDYIAWNDV